MADFVDAYDTGTGEKLAHQVPAHWIDQGLFPNIVATPQAAKAKQRAAAKEAAPATSADTGKGDN